MSEGGEVCGCVVDGQVGTPGGEDLGAAYEQTVRKLIEWVPPPFADALVRLSGRLPSPDVYDRSDSDRRTPSTWSTSVLRSCTSSGRAVRPFSSPSSRTTAVSKDSPGSTVPPGEAGGFVDFWLVSRRNRRVSGSPTAMSMAGSRPNELGANGPSSLRCVWPVGDLSAVVGTSLTLTLGQPSILPGGASGQ